MVHLKMWIDHTLLKIGAPSPHSVQLLRLCNVVLAHVVSCVWFTSQLYMMMMIALLVGCLFYR